MKSKGFNWLFGCFLDAETRPPQQEAAHAGGGGGQRRHLPAASGGLPFSIAPVTGPEVPA